MREKYIHTLGCFTSPRPYDPVIKQSCEGRDSVQDLKTSHNNLDVNLPQLAAEPKANLLVYVINRNGQPLMPCKPAKAKHLLKGGRAKVIRRKPFTIQLLWDCEENVHPITLGVDSGYSNIGLSAISEKQELFSALIRLRNIVKLNSERRMYRRTRRSGKGKLWHRKSRFLNRVKNKKKGWLAPSIQHKLDTHIKIINRVKEILPITKIIVEVANFDIQKVKNPDIQGVEYQQGEQLSFWNVREYILHRDDHTCQHCKGKTKDSVLEVHHIKSRQVGGNRPNNLITLCKTCHDMVSRGKLILNIKSFKGFKAETFMSIVRWKLINQLRDLENNVYHTYGYITKANRIKLGLEKSHTNDAFAMIGGKIQNRCKSFIVKQNRRNSRKLQTNRKGFKPSIRSRRYEFQPGSLVRLNNKIYTTKGIFNLGEWIRLEDKQGKILNVNIKKVNLLVYQKGFAFGY